MEKFNRNSANSIMLAVVSISNWTIRFFQKMPLSDTSEVSMRNGSLEVGSEHGSLAVISILGEIIDHTFLQIGRTDEDIYFARNDCPTGQIRKLQEISKLQEELQLRRRLAQIAMDRNPDYPYPPKG